MEWWSIGLRIKEKAYNRSITSLLKLIPVKAGIGMIYRAVIPANAGIQNR